MYKYRVETCYNGCLDGVLQCNTLEEAQDYYDFKYNHIKTYRYNGSARIIENSTNKVLCSTSFHSNKNL